MYTVRQLSLGAVAPAQAPAAQPFWQSLVLVVIQGVATAVATYYVFKWAKLK